MGATLPCAAVHYRPEGKSAVALNGQSRFNRALYSPTHSGFRLECSDTPEFGLYNPRMGGNLLLTLPDGDCTARYTPGRMDYMQGGVEVSAVMDPNQDRALWRITNTSAEPHTVTLRYGGANDKRFSREGDLGVDPPGCFDFKPENCTGNEYAVNGTEVRVAYGTKERKTATLVTPLPGAWVTTVPALEQHVTLAPGQTVYMSYQPDGNAKGETQKQLKTAFDRAEKKRAAAVSLFDFDTPDEMLNPVGQALCAAAQGIWGGDAWLHGSIGWRTPHLGWRGAYAGDALGMYTEARKHFESYADNQITGIPAVLPHPAQDSVLNLARARKEWGTPMYSNGYICRRPGHRDEMSHYDMNMVYADALLRHLRNTGNREEMKRFYPVLKRHLEWEKLNFDPDGDHLYDGYACIWASDALYYSGGAATHSTACNLFANRHMAQVARAIGEDPTPWETEANGIARAMDSALWLPDKGHWAECRDLMGLGRTHDTPGLWTIYHAVDSEAGDPFKAYAATCYVDSCIPHIPVGDGLSVISTTSWKPYSWSINNVAIAEIMHMALAYWEAGRPDEAYALMRAVMKDNMYDGASPLNFGQISKEDAARGECYRDFADPVGVWSRALAEGLFGISADMLADEPHVTVRPGFPTGWDKASVNHATASYSFASDAGHDTYTVTSHRGADVPVWLEIPVKGKANVTVNGRKTNYETLEPSFGMPRIRVKLKGRAPQKVDVAYTSPLAGTPTGGTHREGNVTFTCMADGNLKWWTAETQPYASDWGIRNGFDQVNTALCEPVDISGHYNDKVTSLFTNKYLSPRPAVTTLQIPVQGVGEWCHPKLTATVDDSGLRRRLARNGGVLMTQPGVPFAMPAEGSNVLFTSLWDNYPDSASVPLSGRASHLYLLLAGSTNHMQCHMENARVTVRYKDGTVQTLPLVNPDNWAPAEQDFYNDNGAFRLPEGLQPPMRLHFATGRASRHLGDALGIKGVEPRTIPGGAGVMIDLPTDPGRELESLQLRTLSNDVVAGLMAVTAQRPASAADWYPVLRDNKPCVRWWWHGSAVDPEGLDFNLSEFAAKSMGGVEITPIYGVQDNEHNDIPYLSDKWMEMLRHTMNTGDSLALRIDMNNGTGWPFGGPNVTVEHSARKLITDSLDMTAGQTVHLVPGEKGQRGIATLQRVMAIDGNRRLDLTHLVTADTTFTLPADMPRAKVYAIWSGRTLQKVKRAAPGGEGLVVNHLDSNHVKHYLERFDEAFARTGTRFPGCVFNDSYEVYGANWDDRLLAEFEKDHGYRLEEWIDVFTGGTPSDFRSRLYRDYRVTLARMLEENFTLPWLAWAHGHGAEVRNQSHGSPANIIDIYADVDTPECESFGQSDFDIPGLGDSGPKRPSDAEAAVLKFASSATNLTGKPYTSAETLTWLTEHFRTSWAHCKPELDLMLSSGVNRVYFHGATYSPKGAEFPGRLFYAAINMSPTNPLWQHVSGMFDYVGRVQAFMTQGEPDNDLLLYFPYEDILHDIDNKPYLMFDIHSMEKTMPAVKQAVRDITAAGYDMDYVSDRLLQRVDVDSDGTLRSQGGASGYKAIIVPGARYMSLATLSRLDSLACGGAKVIVTGAWPESLPGNVADKTPVQFKRLLASLKAKALHAPTVAGALALTGAQAEPLKRDNGLHMLRRKSPEGGHNYFIALNNPNAIDGEVELATAGRTVILFDPVTGKSGRVPSALTPEGRTRFRLQLQPGQSLLIKNLGDEVEAPLWQWRAPKGKPIELKGKWTLDFTNSVPEVTETFKLDRPVSWTKLGHEVAPVLTGTGRYTTEFNLPKSGNADGWLLDLGQVNEAAVVRVNGREVATLWSVPYRVDISDWVRPGKNTLEIEVTSLDANRIADWERRGVKWRVFKDANIASVTGAKTFSFGDWDTVDCGLTGPVTLQKLEIRN